MAMSAEKSPPLVQAQYEIARYEARMFAHMDHVCAAVHTSVVPWAPVVQERLLRFTRYNLSACR